MLSDSLLAKYNIPVPRYTSYPTVPNWNFSNFNLETWKENINRAFVSENGEVCIYIHLPYCEELCTYCACNKHITKNHAVELPYIHALIKEWKMYQTLTNKPIIIKEIHLGGGTPTFFSAANLAFLINSITEGCEISSNHEFSIEIHPNYTTYQQLEVLSKLGYNRISIGIQDFDPTVQFIINRIQTYEQTAMVVNWARELNFESINFDIIYGLPLQTLSIIEQTIEKVMTLHPDRIAFYSYAHVPWKSKGQRRYSEIDLPSGNQKMAMYNLVYKKLTEKGYKSIGMDHFALQSDKLWQAYLEGNLHRNFMGYTTTNHKLVIGLGASSISDTWTAFAQNEKTPELYMEKINKGIFPIIDGHLLDAQDLSTRQHILNLMCKGITYIDTTSLPNFEQAKYTLEEMENDGLIEWNRDYILVLEKGKLLIRNICSVLDLYLLKNDINKYSRAI